MTTTVERLAGWAADLRLEDVPEPVLELCRSQRRSVVAAMAASASDDAARRVLDGVASWAGDGPVELPGIKRAIAVDDAIYAATVLSIALDFDDYACFAHTGHSAVLVPALIAAETGASGPEQLVAQVVANEVEARLGGACLLGPLNGQLWSFVHAAGASLAAGRLLGLDGARLAHALAIALYQAPRPTVPGFMGPDSKLLTAADPTVTGLRAARLAAAGVTGPLDALDHPRGFFDAFAYAALPNLLGGLGEGWATKTLSIKRYPGCAYVDTLVDALLELGPLDPDEVRSVDVDAGLLTCEMDALSRGYLGGNGPPTPVTVNFSVPWNVAIAVVAGAVTPTQLDPGWLAENHAALARVAGVVTLHHDWPMTLRTADAMAPVLAPRALVDGTSRSRLAAAVRRLRRDHEGLRTSPRDAMSLVRSLRGVDLRQARDATSGRRLWDPGALDRFAMTFPARVRVVRRDGSDLVAEADVPLGGAGSPREDPHAASREKLAAWGPAAWGADGTTAIATAIESDDGRLWAALGAP